MCFEMSVFSDEMSFEKVLKTLLLIAGIDHIMNYFE